MILILIIVAALFPLASIPWIIGYYTKSKKTVLCALLMGMAMASICLGLQHVAEGTASQGDISRYATYVDIYHGISFDEAFSLRGDPFDNYPLTTVWFWLVSQSEFAYSLQASAAFINYSIVFYFLFDYSKNEDFSSGQTILGAVFIFCVFPFFYSVSALRSTVALLLCMLAVYFDLRKTQHRVITLVLYLGPCLIHSTAYLVVIVRILYQVLKKSPYFLFVGGLISVPTVLALSAVFSSLFSIFNVNIVEMLSSYSDWTGTHVNEASSALFYSVLKVVNILFMVLFAADGLFTLKGQKGSLDERGRGVYAFCLAMAGFVTSLALFVLADSYLRFTYALYPIIAIIIVSCHFPSAMSLTGGARVLSTSILVRKTGYLVCMGALFALHAFAFYKFVQPIPIMQSAFLGVASLFI